jgi:hypothetical protein
VQRRFERTVFLNNNIYFGGTYNADQLLQSVPADATDGTMPTLLSKLPLAGNAPPSI